MRQYENFFIVVDHIAIGRKIWMFLGSNKGGQAAAILTSLIASCQRHAVDPFFYLADLIERLTVSLGLNL